MGFEQWSPQPYENQPNQEALAEQRRKYIIQAIETLVTTRKKELLAHPGRHMITLVQRELIAKSGLDKQIASSPKDVTHAEDEFPQSEISAQLFDYFGIPEGDYDALEAKVQSF